MSNKNILFGKFWTMKDKLAEKKVNIVPSAKGPSPDEIIAGIQAVQKVDYAITGGERNVIVAELPNCTFELRNSLNVLVDTKTNDTVNGGIANLVATSDDLYTVIATIGGVQQWTNTVEILGAGSSVLYAVSVVLSPSYKT